MMYSLYFFLLILLAPNLRISPIEGPISWLLLIPLSYFFCTNRSRFIFPPAPFLKCVLFSCLLLSCLFLFTANILFLKYLLVISFSSILYTKSLASFIRFALARLNFCFYIYNLLLIILLFLHFSFSNIFYLISTNFMATYYGSVLRFSGLNGEPGPNIFAIILIYIILLILLSLSNSSSLIVQSPTFQLSIVLTIFSSLITFSLGAFLYLTISVFISLLITFFISFNSSFPLVPLYSKFIKSKRLLFTLPLFLLILSSFIFIFYDSFEIFFIKVLSFLTAILSNNFSQIPSRGYIFSTFLNTNSIFDFSLLFDPNVSRTNVSAILSSTDQGSILLTLIIFLLPSLYFLKQLLFLFSKSPEYLYSHRFFIFFTQLGFLFSFFNYFTIPEIHLYKFFLYLLFHSLVSSYCLSKSSVSSYNTLPLIS